MSFLPEEIWHKATDPIEQSAGRYFAILRWLLWGPLGKDNSWRPQIDGLRAVSVLAVLFYHTNFRNISGGFVGVDVFFVISGFLISRVIYDDIAAHGKFRIARFYERRARRILPAFVVVTAGTVIAGFVLFLPKEFAALGQSVTYSCAFAANIYFYLTSGYFDGAAADKPLLHYWSLGVEEQFYIVFPLIVMAIAKLAPRRLGTVILLVAVISFVSAQYYTVNAPAAAFYLAPQRAWELMAGSILALPGMPVVKQRWPCEILAAVGLALILLAAATYSSATSFPGMMAGVPVLGAATLLWVCEGRSTLVGAVLSVRPLRYIGLWSYSIYMIHWPLIVFARDAWPSHNSYREQWIVFAAIALGGASYYFVETPFRRPARLLSRGKVFAISCTSLMMFGISGQSISLSHGFPQRLPKDVQGILAYGDAKYSSIYMSDYRSGNCFLSSYSNWTNLGADCLSKEHPSMLLWGDSHAAQFYLALKTRFPDVVILQANMSSCAPILEYQITVAPHCTKFNESVFHWALTNRPDTVILSALWPLDPDSLSKLDATVKRLRTAHLKVVIVGETPRYLNSVPDILARRLLQGDHYTRAGNDAKMGSSYNGDNHMKSRYSGLQGVRYLSYVDMACDEPTCPLVTPSGVPMYFDTDHLTMEGAQWVVRRLFAQVGGRGYYNK
jgi:peptidoglycan/LPS O-acetylase OafA/YrhL